MEDKTLSEGGMEPAPYVFEDVSTSASSGPSRSASGAGASGIRLHDSTGSLDSTHARAVERERELRRAADAGLAPARSSDPDAPLPVGMSAAVLPEVASEKFDDDQVEVETPADYEAEVEREMAEEMDDIGAGFPTVESEEILTDGAAPSLGPPQSSAVIENNDDSFRTRMRKFREADEAEAAAAARGVVAAPAINPDEPAPAPETPPPAINPDEPAPAPETPEQPEIEAEAEQEPILEETASDLKPTMLEEEASIPAAPSTEYTDVPATDAATAASTEAPDPAPTPVPEKDPIAPEVDDKRLAWLKAQHAIDPRPKVVPRKVKEITNWVEPDLYGRGYKGIHGPNAEAKNAEDAKRYLDRVKNARYVVRPGDHVDYDMYGRADPRIFGAGSHIASRKQAAEKSMKLQKEAAKKGKKGRLVFPVADKRLQDKKVPVVQDYVPPPPAPEVVPEPEAPAASPSEPIVDVDAVAVDAPASSAAAEGEASAIPAEAAVPAEAEAVKDEAISTEKTEAVTGEGETAALEPTGAETEPVAGEVGDEKRELPAEPPAEPPAVTSPKVISETASPGLLNKLNMFEQKDAEANEWRTQRAEVLKEKHTFEPIGTKKTAAVGVTKESIPSMPQESATPGLDEIPAEVVAEVEGGGGITVDEALEEAEPEISMEEALDRPDSRYDDAEEEEDVVAEEEDESEEEPVQLVAA